MFTDSTEANVSLGTKILPVDLKTRTVDEMFFSLKEEFKPSSETDVTTIVGFNCEDNSIGSYTDGALAYQKTCQIYLIDTLTQTFSSVGTFAGTEPHSSKKGSGSRTGSHPAKAYLKNNGIM